MHERLITAHTYSITRAHRAGMPAAVGEKRRPSRSPAAADLSDLGSDSPPRRAHKHSRHHKEKGKHHKRSKGSRGSRERESLDGEGDADVQGVCLLCGCLSPLLLVLV